MPVVTKAHKRLLGPCEMGVEAARGGAEPDDHGGANADVFCQLLTMKLVLLPCAGYERQVVGRYFGFTVLGLQTQAMLPAWLVGESTRYWVAEVMALLAFGPL